MFLNKVQLIGNLTRDPELKVLPSGDQKVCSFSLATNETYKKDGNKVEKTEFHNVVAWGRTAEIIAQYSKKGSQLYVEGKLQTRSWDKDGVKHYRTEIMVTNVQLGSKPRGDSAAAPKDDFAEFDQSQAQAAGEVTPDDEINPEDIPF